MIIIITGASRGIGFAIAKEFLSNSENILIICSKQKKNITTAVKQLKEINKHVKIYFKAVDLSNPTLVKSFAKFCLKIGQPDILINNVGIFKPTSILQETEENIVNTLNLNVLSPFLLTQAILPVMIKKKQGHIINICSVASMQGFSNCCAYNISKFALLGFGKYLREELKKHNIKVTNLMPGATFTDSWEGSNIIPERILESSDIAKLIFTIVHLSNQAVVEDVVIRPILGDL